VTLNLHVRLDDVTLQTELRTYLTNCKIDQLQDVPYKVISTVRLTNRKMCRISVIYVGSNTIFPPMFWFACLVL